MIVLRVALMAVGLMVEIGRIMAQSPGGLSSTSDLTYGETLPPVSYTHLDVYKRQLLLRHQLGAGQNTNSNL